MKTLIHFTRIAHVIQTNKVIQTVTELPTRITATCSTQYIVQSVQKHIKNVVFDKDCLGRQWLISFVVDAISTD